MSDEDGVLLCEMSCQERQTTKVAENKQLTFDKEFHLHLVFSQYTDRGTN